MSENPKKIMKLFTNNINSNIATFATSSKWSDSIAFNGSRQLEGDVEIWHNVRALTSLYIISQAVEEPKSL